MKAAFVVAVLLGLCISTASAELANGVACGGCKMISKAIWEYSGGNYTKSLDDQSAFCNKIAPGGIENPFWLMCFLISDAYTGTILATSECKAAHPDWPLDDCFAYQCGHGQWKFCDADDKLVVATSAVAQKLAAPAVAAPAVGCPLCKLITMVAFTAIQHQVPQLPLASKIWCQQIVREGQSSPMYWFCVNVFNKPIVVLQNVQDCMDSGKSLDTCAGHSCSLEFNVCERAVQAPAASSRTVRIVDNMSVAKLTEVKGALGCNICKNVVKLVHDGVVKHKESVTEGLQRFCLALAGSVDSPFFFVCMCIAAEPLAVTMHLDSCVEQGQSWDQCTLEECQHQKLC
eukprot:GILI01030927.1.p1 GENE.GILI01030927.1~~GILI01030927.1.p1  ORF type:complete len:345 (+),score=105.32 GILI01030927.1:45-1079(+)